MAGAWSSRVSLVESSVRMSQSAFAELSCNFVMGNFFASHAGDTPSIGSLSS
jgi:hypothetical protein